MKPNAWTITRHYAGAKWRFQHLRGPALEAFQSRRAWSMVAYAAANSPFYRRHWQGQDLKDWQTLPTVDKTALMEHFDTFNTAGIGREEAMEVACRAEAERDFTPTLRGCTVGLSSGTSGQRGLFLVRPDEQAAWTGVLLARILPRLPLRNLRVALFLRSNSNLYERLNSRLLTFRYFALGLPLDAAVCQLNTFAPDVLVAPPSLLESLCPQITAGVLRLCPTQVISVAEVLEPRDRQRLRAAFHAPIHEIYQATEGLIGITCSHGALHVQEDILAVQTETIDPQQPHYVTPILTDLWRRTQPIVRYRLGDVWKLQSTPCTCGSAFRVIEQIIGRREDVLIFGDSIAPHRSRFLFADTLSSLVFAANPHIVDYQARQHRPGHLRLYLKIQSGAEDNAIHAVRQAVLDWMQAHDCTCDELETVCGLEQRAPESKRQRVRNLTGSRSETGQGRKARQC